MGAAHPGNSAAPRKIKSIGEHDWRWELGSMTERTKVSQARKKKKPEGKE